jgi:hypothetical protein
MPTASAPSAARKPRTPPPYNRAVLPGSAFDRKLWAEQLLDFHSRPGASECIIVLYLMRVADSGTCWLSTRQLAKKLDLSQRATSDALNALRERGMLRALPSAGRARATPHELRFCPRLPS